MDPDQRAELHRRVMLLREQMLAGKLHLAAHLADEFRQSLERVRLASDGLVDPGTVDGRVRATALMVAHFHQREEAKESASLLDIQHAYFARVEAMFGGLHKEMCRRGVEPHRVAGAFASHPENVETNYATFTEFIDELREFWGAVSLPIWVHTEDSQVLKMVFGGSLFPDAEANAASLYGFYSDSIVLSDPFLKLVPILPHWPKDKQVYELIRLGLQVLSYKELALAEVEPPIVVILPDKFGLEDEYREFIWRIVADDVLSHLGRTFGREYSSMEEAEEYVRTLRSPEDVARQAARPDLILFDTEWTGSPAEQITRFLEEEGKLFGLSTAGEVILTHTRSRMGQVTDVLRRSAEVRGVPVVQAPTSWQWLNWKLEYSSFAANAPAEPLHIARALQAVGDAEFTWLGNIPPDALIEMRKTGALREIRERLSTGVAELAAAAPGNFTSTTNLVIGNLRLAFAEHQERMRQLAAARTRFAGKELGSFVVAGAVEIAAAVAGHPLFGAGAAVMGLSGLVPTVKDLKERLNSIRQEEREHHASPVGLLFRRSR